VPSEAPAGLFLIVREAVDAFLLDNGFQAASSLAFYTTLSLVPSLLLLTWLLGLGLGSSQSAMARTELVVQEVIPRFGEVLLREVSRLAHGGAVAGAVNTFALFWSVVPLVGSMRNAVESCFRSVPRRSLWLSTLLDVATGILFVTGFATVAALGVALRILRTQSVLPVPAWLDLGVPFAFSAMLLVFVYWVLSPRVRLAHLVTGSLAAAALWFAMRPAFSLFLTFNPGYGVAFGSLKSLFIVILWVYYSQAAFLFGAELIAALHRKETILIRRLMDGKADAREARRSPFVVRLSPGQTVFREGDAGREAYYVLEGSVGIVKEGREISTIRPGKFFGEMSFLLGHPRSAGAVAREECACIRVDDRNVQALMREFPETVRQMLEEMASRLEKTTGKTPG
jgi:membrane protein